MGRKAAASEAVVEVVLLVGAVAVSRETAAAVTALAVEERVWAVVVTAQAAEG